MLRCGVSSIVEWVFSPNLCGGRDKERKRTHWERSFMRGDAYPRWCADSRAQGVDGWGEILS